MRLAIVPRYAVSVLMMLVGCSFIGCSSGSPDEPTPSGAIGVTIASPTVDMTVGQTVTTAVTVARSGGYDGAVALTFEGAPAGITGTFAPASVAPGSTTSTLTLTAAPTTAAGTYNTTVRVTGQGVTPATASLAISVQAGSAISLALNPVSLTLTQGTSGTSAIQITRTNFPGAVSLAVSGMPNGVTASVAPASVTTNVATLTVNVGATAAPGAYTLTVTGQAPGVGNSMAVLNLIVPAGSVWAQVSAGLRHTCGITTVGAAYCWGYNTTGQLGNGNQVNQSRPVPVAGGQSWSSISAGDDYTCGITTGGAAYCWGTGLSGQLGNGSTSAVQTTPVPVSVSGGDTWAMIATGGVQTCAITSDGRLFCWGDNGGGQLGDGSTTLRTTRVLVSGGRTWRTVSTSGTGVGVNHTCGVTTAGEAFCWGNNTNGQLGDGTAGLGPTRTPVAVAGSRSWATISTGSTHTCGVTTAGDAYCWGENDSGQLGNGNATQQTVPGLVVNDIKWTRVSAGRLTTCGLTLAGAAYCWGANQYGQAGNGNAGGNQTAPVLVAGGFSWSAVDGGWEHNCGRTVNGQGYCWGRGIQGQLGAGSTVVTSTPVRISDP